MNKGQSLSLVLNFQGLVNSAVTLSQVLLLQLIQLQIISVLNGEPTATECLEVATLCNRGCTSVIKEHSLGQSANIHILVNRQMSFWIGWTALLHYYNQSLHFMSCQSFKLEEWSSESKFCS